MHHVKNGFRSLELVSATTKLQSQMIEKKRVRWATEAAHHHTNKRH
jgi:hypothetical protein